MYLLEVSGGPNVIYCFALGFVKGPGNHLGQQTEQDTHHGDHEGDYDDKGQRSLDKRGSPLNFQSEHPEKRKETNRETEYPAAPEDVHWFGCSTIEKFNDQQV